MSTILFSGLFAAAAAFVVTRFSRSARLRQFAALHRARFEKTRSEVLTPADGAKLDFFRKHLHAFYHVLSWTQNAFFLRLCDIKTEDGQGRFGPFITLACGEFKTAEYPALKICPPHSPFAATSYQHVQTNLPEIDARYRTSINAQTSGCLLTPFALSLLRARPDVYLEIHGGAFVYHEHRPVPLAEYALFKLRAEQLAGEFARILLTPTEPAHAAGATPPETDVQAETLLRSLSPQRACAPAPRTAFKTALSVGLLMLLILAPLLSWLYLRRFLQ